jgi:MFS family permease
MRHHDSITSKNQPPTGRRTSSVVYSILIIGFIYTLHLVLPVYVNSSFLSTFTDERTVGILYTVGSIVTILGLFGIEKILQRFGNYRTSIALVLIQMVLFYGLITANSFLMISIIFVLSSAVVAFIGFNLDVYLETYTDVHHTGGVRGLYMAINNSAWILAPLIGAILVGGGALASSGAGGALIGAIGSIGASYRNVYIAALAVLFILLFLMYKNLRHFKDPDYNHDSLRTTLLRVFKNEDLSKLFAANLILNIFYDWMIIYMPIYLHQTIGFGWDQIGIILTIMLLPFVIFQFPAGKLADAGWGEKKIMSFGFLILGLTTCGLAYINGANLIVWAIALFATRIGASIAEVMIEAYFFKKVPPADADLLGSFRITRYAAYIIAPIITAIGLAYTTSANLFIILGLIVLWALRYSLTITDVV